MLRPAFVKAAAAALDELARESPGRPGLVVGAAMGATPAGCTTRVALVDDGRVDMRLKHELPELRRLRREAGVRARPVARAGRLPRRPARRCPSARTCGSPRSWRISPRAAPSCCSCRTARPSRWRSSVSVSSWRGSASRESGLPLAYVNQVGGQDELVFDGGSFVMNGDGALAHVLPFWQEALAVTRWNRAGSNCVCGGEHDVEPEPRLAAIYQRDGARAARLRARRTVSAASCSASPAESTPRSRPSWPWMRSVPERVRGVRLPSRFTSDSSMDDAVEARDALGIPLETVPIAGAVDALERRWRRCSPDGRATWPRRTSRRAPAALLLMAMLEQVRRAAGDHRQQVGDVGRLRHVVRRHVRRLLGAEGRLQDRGLRPLTLAQRARARKAPWARQAASSPSRR